MLHAHPRQYHNQKSNFQHNLKSKCQSKSVTMTKQLTYFQTKETNRIKHKKIEIIEKITDFFRQILQCDNGCNFFGCLDAIIRCDIFPKKNVGCDFRYDEMRLPSLLISHWNDRQSRRAFLCFYSAVFKLTSAKFQTFALN